MTGTYLNFGESLRRQPTDAMVDQIRLRYPTDREIDAVLTRKMHRRHGPGYVPVSIERLVSGGEALVSKQLGYDVHFENAKWLSGGASKLQMVFDLSWRGPGGKAESVARSRMVLRMEPAASITESSRLREFEVLKAVENIIPVPSPFWVDADAQYLPYPGMIYSFAAGVAKPSADATKVSGLGQNYGPELRSKLAPQFVELLARLHTIDIPSSPMLEHFDRPVVGSNASIIQQVNATRRIWEEDRIDEEPVMEIVFQWLIRNAPPLDHVSIVHGDYRSGNFLFDEAAGKITAWLDWEGATLGDRHQDLTYASLPIFEHISEDGRTALASGMMAADDLYEAYEARSGLKVDPKRLAYFSIYNRYLATVLTLAAAARASQAAATHQDVLVNFVGSMGYLALSDLRNTFVKVAA